MSINFKVKDKKPCPFCGSTDIEMHTSGNSFDEKPLWLECNWCGACGPTNYDFFKDAEKGWDNRVNTEK